MNQAAQKALRGSVVRIMRPLVRLLLRYGVPYGVFADIAKQVYVDIADNEFGLPGRKQTNSRIAVITGLNRKEVLRIQRLPNIDNQAIEERYNRATRVLSGWRNDSAFKDNSGRSRSLPFEGGEVSFSRLVNKHSGDMPARAVLDELKRIGAVEILKNGSIRLKSNIYAPNEEEESKLVILGTDVADLIESVDYNIDPEHGDSRLQLKVSYDNLPHEAVQEFERLSSHQSVLLLQKFDKWLAAHDRDADQETDGNDRYRAGIGIYYFEEDLSDTSTGE